MSDLKENAVADLLVANIPRDLVLGVEDALAAGAIRAFGAAAGMEAGHLAHAVGHMRHFHMNEAFHRALTAADASPSPIHGNGLVVGRKGIFAVARFNMPVGVWERGARSKLRRQMSTANQAIEHLIHPQLFEPKPAATDGVVFFVACFSGLQENVAAVHIAVPDRKMKSWLFRESLAVFLRRYEQAAPRQEDLAKPKLKKNVDKRDEGGGTV